MANIEFDSQKSRLRDEYRKCMHDAEELRKQFDGKSDDLGGTKLTEYENLVNRCDQIKSLIIAMDEEAKLKKWGDDDAPGTPQFASPKIDVDPKKAANAEKLAAFKQYLKGPEHGITAETYIKAYQADSQIGGGFALAPQELASQWLTLMKDLMFMRQMGTLFTVPTAESLGIVAIDTDPSDSDWTAEVGSVSDESTLALGKRELKPQQLTKEILVSRKLIRMVSDFDAHVLDRLAYKMSITQEKAFISGTGAEQPLGIFTASSLGISTGRDFTAAGSTSFAGDDFIGMFGNLKAQYRARSSWFLNRSVVTAIRKLKDSSNNYLWQPGMNNQGFVAQGSALIQGFPDMLMGRPILESEYAPNTVTSGLYTAVLGDFSKYYIADSLAMTIQVLYELYAKTNQIGYILRSETDGMPVLEEAFTRLKMA